MAAAWSLASRLGVSPDAAPGARAARHPNLILIVLALATMSSALQQSLVIPALPDIQRELGVSTATASWILSAYLLSAGVATPIAGRLGDMYGKKRTLEAILAIFVVGTIVTGAASSFVPLIAGRVLQGISSGVFPLAFGLVRDQFSAERVGLGIGVLGSMLGVGSGAGVILAGPIVSGLSYHWLFWLTLVPTLVALVAARVVVPESAVRTGGRVSWTSALAMSLGLVLLLLGLTMATRWGWGSPRTLGLFALAAAVLGAWAASERRSDAPLVDVRILALRGIWTANLVSVMLGAAMYSTYVLIPQLAREPRSTGFGLGSSLFEAGLYLAPSTIAMLAVGMLAGRVQGRFGLKPALLAGGLVGLISQLTLTFSGRSPALIAIAAGLLGVGFGLSFAAMTTLAVQSVTERRTGIAGGMNHLSRLIGSALGAQLAATVLDSHLDASGGRTSHGYTLAFGVGAVALLLGVIGAALAPGVGRADLATTGGPHGV
jgi:MFS family permease